MYRGICPPFIWEKGGHTSCEETVFGKDGYGVDEEDGDCACMLVFFAVKGGLGFGGFTVEEVSETEEYHCCGWSSTIQDCEGSRGFCQNILATSPEVFRRDAR